MTKQRRKHRKGHHEQPAKPERQEQKRQQQPPPAPSGPGTFLSRLLAAILVPALLIGGVELGLRLCGVGYPTGFFIRAAGSDSLTTNQRFGWRFFPKQVARNPTPALIPRRKPAGTIRVFVLGGSAALGIPDAAYSCARILQVLLEEAYPGTSFQVVNAAMTAINSHVVRDIAADCCDLEPDALVVYLGNNEVVGPYGPGTVFDPLSESLTLTRLGMGARTTRIGQLLAGVAGRLPAGEQRLGAWKGMEMFVGRRVSADDQRLATVYRNLRRNLSDITEMASGAGVPVLLSTVATNLADCPPFASLNRPDLDDARRKAWQQHLAAGLHALADPDPDLKAAVRSFGEALQVDDRHAELHFHLATALRSLGRSDEALHHFRLARDLDALRFRADSTINRAIREVAAAGEGHGVLLVDGEQALETAPETRDNILGGELLYEHVHLRFAGNYRLAMAMAEQLVVALDEQLPAGNGWLPAERCAELLGLTDWDRYRMLAEIVAMTCRPPFTGQYDHTRRLSQLRFELRQLRHAMVGRMDEEERRHRLAVQRCPDDLLFRVRLAELLRSREDWAGAVREWRALIGMLPGNPVWHTDLGHCLLDMGETGQAVRELECALRLQPEVADTHVNLALALQRQGELAAAEELLLRAIEINPAAEVARLNLASLLVTQERFTEAAAVYEELLRDAPSSAEAHFGQGVLHERLQQYEPALAAYRRAIALDPDLAKAGNNLGYLLQRLERMREAEQVYRRTCELSPHYALAQFNLGDLLLSSGRAAEAIPCYRQGLGERPLNHAARVNLAVALQLVGRPQEAAGQYQEIISQEPDHPRALIGLAWLLATTDDPILRDLSEAVRLGERAVQLSKGADPTILESMAAIYETAGQRDQARQLRARNSGG